MEKRSCAQVPKLRAIKRAICEIFIGKALLNLRDILWGTMSNKNYPRALGTKQKHYKSRPCLFYS